MPMLYAFPIFAANIATALNKLCTEAVGILGASTVTLIVLSAIIYGIGQVLGAETRARASVWATAMIIGALISIIIYITLPPIFEMLYGDLTNCAAGAARPPAEGGSGGTVGVGTSLSGTGSVLGSGGMLIGGGGSTLCGVTPSICSSSGGTVCEGRPELCDSCRTNPSLCSGGVVGGRGGFGGVGPLPRPLPGRG